MKSPNVCRLIMYGVILLGFVVVCMALLQWQGQNGLPALFYIGAALAFGGVVFGAIFVRCPHCGRQQPLKGVWYEYCPHCGEKLER